MRIHLPTIEVLGLCALLGACSGTITPEPPADAGADAGQCVDTWEGYGQAFFATTCVSCHSHDHSPFAILANVQADLLSIHAKVSAGVMPLDAGLPPADRQRLLTFIECGAPAAGVDAGFAYEAVSPASAVAKVKYLLVGLPPTDLEVQAVAADPGAMRGLVTGWMQQSEYTEKMRVFFELAFQQTQLTSADLIDLIPNSVPATASPLLVQNMRESFARTVLAQAASSRPFRDAFTTHQLMLTPALMQLYAFLDARRTDDLAKLDDQWFKANRTAVLVLQADAGVVTAAEWASDGGASYLHFYNPRVGALTFSTTQLCNTDPIVMPATSDNLWYAMYGIVNNHKEPLADGGTITCNFQNTTVDVFSPTDFTDWRPVTIRPPAAGEATTRFFDLATMRAATELVLSTPRVGFFTTPAFLANWPTNQSNQMRVTLNQALIVATGHAVEATDPTVTSSTPPGLDTAHASDPACFNCHRLLDPARSILSSTYSWFYTPQTDPLLIAQKGTFAFQGTQAPVNSVDDLADVLARHPLMASAWAQKLCEYANSGPCATDDPEFTRVVAAFASGGGTWSTLVRELMSSPLVTNLAPTATYAARGEVIAVSRRDHLCQALDARLGLTDVCGLTLLRGKRSGVGQVPAIAAGLPSDGYGRGATEPILPNTPTLFYRSGLENICAQLSSQVVDPAADAGIPTTARRWASSQPSAALDDFVTLLVGLPPGDPRWRAVRALLQDHFTQAQVKPTDGGVAINASTALRSAFVTACLAPTLIGIGL